MSHSAHRLGTKEEFAKDYVVFVKPARGIDDVYEKTKAETINYIDPIELYLQGPVR